MALANVTPPTISGSAVQGQTLHSTPGTWTGTAPIAYVYQWLRCDAAGANCTPIAGAHSSAYYIVAADVGHTLRVEVVATEAADPPAPNGTGPSNIAMPVGDIAGWRQVFTDDFDTWTCNLGQWPSGGGNPAGPASAGGRWLAYPAGWTYEPSATVNGQKVSYYWPEKTLSVNVGSAAHCMDYWHHYDSASGRYLCCSPLPQIKQAAGLSNLTSLRTAVCFKPDNISWGSWHPSFLLWPDSGVWPRDGEIDFPEGSYGGRVQGYVHLQNGTWAGDQVAWENGTVNFLDGWNVYVTEWKAGQFCRFILNGVTVVNVTSRVPNTPMHCVLQSGLPSNPNQGISGHILIDWFAAWVST